MIRDELLFYIGISVAILSLVLLVILSLVFRIREYKLNTVFDMEYGMETKLESEKVKKPKK